jgi:hypothetical protein
MSAVLYYVEELKQRHIELSTKQINNWLILARLVE